MADEADLAYEQSERLLEAGIYMAKRGITPLTPLERAKAESEAFLVRQGLCMNCGERVPEPDDGQAPHKFCPPVSTGRSECQIDYERREGRRML